MPPPSPGKPVRDLPLSNQQGTPCELLGARLHLLYRPRSFCSGESGILSRGPVAYRTPREEFPGPPSAESPRTFQDFCRNISAVYTIQPVVDDHNNSVPTFRRWHYYYYFFLLFFFVIFIIKGIIKFSVFEKTFYSQLSIDWQILYRLSPSANNFCTPPTTTQNWIFRFSLNL